MHLHFHETLFRFSNKSDAYFMEVQWAKETFMRGVASYVLRDANWFVSVELHTAYSQVSQWTQSTTYIIASSLEIRMYLQKRVDLFVKQQSRQTESRSSNFFVHIKCTLLLIYGCSDPRYSYQSQSL